MLRHRSSSGKSPLWESFIGFKADGTHPETSTSQTIIGARLDSEEPPHVLQCRVGGFTFSRLTPYTRLRMNFATVHGRGGRNSARSFARELWRVSLYDISTRSSCDCRSTVSVNISRAAPSVPDAVPQGLSGFLQRVIIPDADNNCTSIVTQALEGPPFVTQEGASITVLLDVDVFRAVNLDGGLVDEIWSGLEDLRVQKNRMFFEHLTEKTMEMFQ